MTPPPVYETWWNDLELCSGVSGDFHAVSWYYIPGSAGFRSGSGADVLGIWQPVGNAIVIAEAALQDQWVVAHEELHALLKRTDHPPEYFSQKCANEVAH